MSLAEYPGRVASTMKPRTVPASSFAQMMAMSAMLPLVIQNLVPFSTQPSPLRRARVIMPPGSLP